LNGTPASYGDRQDLRTIVFMTAEFNNIPNWSKAREKRNPKRMYRTKVNQD